MKLKVFTMGGTIDKIYFDKKSDYEVGAPAVGSILREAGVGFPWEVESLIRKDSLDMTDADRRLLWERVSAAAEERILVTHGSDTMIASAKLLKKVTGKTIVLTGAIEPAMSRTSDAPFNVGCAVAAVQILPPGVYIVMNGCIFDPDKVKKNLRLNRFEAVGQALR
ncbi:MAG: asparaginase domain-containing protein [Thermodesulfobacteriota bacterium]